MLTLLPTPIGNLEDITFRAVDALKNSSTILCEDTRVAKRLLHLLEQKFQLFFGKKSILPFHEHNQEEFLKSIAPSFFEKGIVFMSDAGMPGISDPGAKLVQYVQEHGIKYEVLPGASAFVTAFVASGFEGKFCFFGFLPHKKEARESKLEEMLKQKEHTILYESPHRLLKLLEFLAKKVPKRELFLAKELTKRYESFYKGSAKELYEKLKNEEIKGEWVVVIHKAFIKEKKITFSYEDILALQLPPKQKAKLLAQVSDKSVKEIYKALIDPSSHNL